MCGLTGRCLYVVCICVCVCFFVKHRVFTILKRDGGDGVDQKKKTANSDHEAKTYSQNLSNKARRALEDVDFVDRFIADIFGLCIGLMGQNHVSWKSHVARAAMFRMLSEILVCARAGIFGK